jgi:hypothetical protein
MVQMNLRVGNGRPYHPRICCPCTNIAALLETSLPVEPDPAIFGAASDLGRGLESVPDGARHDDRRWEATMTSPSAVRPEVATARRRYFDHVAAIVRCHTVNLVNAINHLNYPIAWSVACDLGRAVVHAESIVLRMPSGAERARAASRLGSLRDVAMLARAPHPSPLAIAQARSPVRGVDRSTWSPKNGSGSTLARRPGRYASPPMGRASTFATSPPARPHDDARDY